MATLLNNNILDGATVTFNEDGGVLREVNATARVKDVNTTSLQAAIASALDTPFLPEAGDSITYGGETVILESRSGTMTEPGHASIELTYRRQSGFDVSAGVRLLERIDQFDKEGTQVTVEWKEGVPEPIQGGEFTALIPVATITYEWVEQVEKPGAYLKGWIGKTNSDNWEDGEAGTWMALDAAVQLVDETASPRKWRFSMEFAHDPDGWNPQVIYIDERTGRPPKGLEADVGYKTVEKYEQRNFGGTFPG